MDLLWILLRYLLRALPSGISPAQPALALSPAASAKSSRQRLPVDDRLPADWLDLGPPFPGAACSRDRGRSTGLTESPPPGGGGVKLRY